MFLDFKLYQSYKQIKKILTFFSNNELKKGFLIVGIVIGMAFIETLTIASIMPFLSLLGNPGLLETNELLKTFFSYCKNYGISNKDDFLIVLGTLIFVIIIFSAIYRTFTIYAMNQFIEMQRHNISLRLLENFLRQPYTFFLNRHSGDLSKTILFEVDQVIGSVIRPTINMLANFLVFAAITCFLVIVNPIIAILTGLMLSVIYVIVYLLLNKKLFHLGSTLVKANKERFITAGEVFGGIKEIKLLGNEKVYLNRYSTSSETLANTQANKHTYDNVPNYLIEAIIFGVVISLTIVLVLTSGGIDEGSFGKVLPILGIYAFGAYRIRPAVHNVYQGFANLKYGQAIVDSIYDNIHSKVNIMALPIKKPNPINVKKSINLKNVSFSFPGIDLTTLNNINLHIPVGQSLGIVGSTGAGKTTLVDIILGLLTPSKGSLSVDGESITNKNVRAWQQSLGYVPQDIYLMDTSILENIAMGIPKELINYSQVEKCAKMAQVHNFINKELPSGYKTIVGERGVRLSGGQRQRIGIARALYNNPEILVFDEATSALDSVTEKAVMQSIESISNKKTTIIIAHRLSTVKNCKNIVLLKDGYIESEGDFKKLLKNSNQFTLMAKNQS